MVNLVTASPPPMGYQGARKTSGDMHEFVNENFGLLVVGEVVKMVGNDFDNVMSFDIECVLPNARHSPNTGAGAGGRALRSKRDDTVWVDVRHVHMVENVEEASLDVGGFVKVHRAILLYLGA